MENIISSALTQGTPESIQSAIVMMDGTELFYSSDYQNAKKEYNEDGNIPFFIMIVRPLWDKLVADFMATQGE